MFLSSAFRSIFTYFSSCFVRSMILFKFNDDTNCLGASSKVDTASLSCCFCRSASSHASSKFLYLRSPVSFKNIPPVASIAASLFRSLVRKFYTLILRFSSW